MDESKRQLWEARFEEQANSGMTVDAWCTSKQLNKYTYYYWKQRVRKAKMEPMKKEIAAPLFAKLEMPAASDETTQASGLIIRSKPRKKGAYSLVEIPNECAPTPLTTF